LQQYLTFRSSSSSSSSFYVAQNAKLLLFTEDLTTQVCDSFNNISEAESNCPQTLINAGHARSYDCSRFLFPLYSKVPSRCFQFLGKGPVGKTSSQNKRFTRKAYDYAGS
jgi:hypothetical protein